MANPSLDHLVQDALVLVDTSTLMDPLAHTALLQTLAPSLVSTGTKLVVPYRVIRELNKFRDSRSVLAQAGVKILAELQGRALLDVAGDDDDAFPDALFLAVATRFRTKQPVVLVTQDVRLMVDFLSQNHAHSFRPRHPLSILTASADVPGHLRPVTLQEAERRLKAQLEREPTRPVSVDVPPPNRRATAPVPAVDLTAIAPISIDTELRTLNESVRLRVKTLLGSGREGSVYATSITGSVAKLFRPEHLKDDRFAKLRSMLSVGFDASVPEAAGICWPLDILLDSDGNPRGYLMRQALGRPLHFALFAPGERDRDFPHWRREQLSDLCLKIVEKVALLHRMNVLLCDFNPSNFLLTTDGQLFLVDTDSYQIGGFPSKVVFPDIMAPELIASPDFRWGHDLITNDHELFSLGTLIFMVLMLGKHPYAQIGGETNRDNIAKRVFPYRLGERATYTAPDGNWRYIWSNLSYPIKEAFYETFDGSCTGRPRRSAEEWRALLHRYVHAIRQGWLTNDLIPKTFKEPDPEMLIRRGRRGIRISCAEPDCGTRFLFTEEEQEFYKQIGPHMVPPKRCRDHRGRRRSAPDAEELAEPDPAASPTKAATRPPRAAAARTVKRHVPRRAPSAPTMGAASPPAAAKVNDNWWNSLLARWVK